MAFPVLAMAIGAGLGALYSKSQGGSNRDMLKSALIGGALGAGAGYAFPQTFGSSAMAQASLAKSGAVSVGKGVAAQNVGLAANLKALPMSAKLAGGAGLASMAFTPKPFEPKPVGDLFNESEYNAEYEKQRENVEGLGQRFDYGPPQQMANLYNYNQPNEVYSYAKGGIVENIPSYKEGGVSYLPSKLDHDEKDTNNYVRAEGYIEDATDIADKDKDTMLAQLADGEFVSRADAILGAGIMQGADPKDFKEMRAKGAKFFYGQQDQLKRIYDLVT